MRFTAPLNARVIAGDRPAVVVDDVRGSPVGAAAALESCRTYASGIRLSGLCSAANCGRPASAGKRARVECRRAPCRLPAAQSSVLSNTPTLASRTVLLSEDARVVDLA